MSNKVRVVKGYAEREPELATNPEIWKEQRVLLDYDPVNFNVIDQHPGVLNGIRLEIPSALKYSLHEILENKSGHLKKDQQSYYRSGEENTDGADILLGKVNGKFCIIGDEESGVIISPLFDRLLYITPEYIDVDCGGLRLRLSRGSYTMSETRSETKRGESWQWADDIPDCFDEDMSIKISLLEQISAKELTHQANEFLVRPLEASHELFASTEMKIIEHITGGEPTPELAAKLQNVDEALHMPSVSLRGQTYTLTLRTSEAADVIFLHNSSIQTNQDRVAESLLKMAIPEFLELAYDTSLQRSLLYETLSERGFHFVRQHDGQLFIMDRDMQRDTLVTPDDAHFGAILQQVQTQLNEYFQAVNEQKPASVPLRSIRIAAGIAIQEEAEKRQLRQRSFGQKFLTWLGLD